MAVPCALSRSKSSGLAPMPLMMVVRIATSPRTWSACRCVMKMREILVSLRED